MDPVKMDCQGVWHIDEKCLAPYSDNDELKEAVVKSIEHKEDEISYAVVSFMDATERRIPLRHLCKASDYNNCWNTSIFDDEDLEKPFFPDQKPAAPAASFPLSNTGVFVPFTINRYLRDYQRDGIRFLYEHYMRSTGCILGDDMGLGKTIQVISLLAAVLHKTGTREDIENNMPEFLLRTMKKKCSTESVKRVFLIVSPLSVLYNWRDELETWGYFKVAIIHGNKKDFQLGRLKQGKYEIALTTYETLRLCLDDLNSIEWSAVIVDEAHRIKNPKARVTQTMKSLRCKVRIGLTGTILQNNMEELWCVMDWAVPGCFGSKNQFKEEFSNPVELGQRHNATKRELATGRKVMQKLAVKMSSSFLRRTKALISDQLPKKEDRIVYCALSEFQKAVYQTVLETKDVSLVLRGGETCSCSSGLKRRRCCYRKNQYGESVKTLYFSYLAILRKVANHAALLQSDANTSKKQDAHIQRICVEVFSKFPEFVQQSKEAAFETISDPKYSGKMKVLQQLLNHCRKNKDKVLLFSFSTKLLDVLERYCMASGLEYRRLDGSTKAEDRVNIVKEFNTVQDVNICLVSTMAGGLGLNFVGANIVVIFDPTWNPANDLQAIDRAYRIGQCRDVKVFRLISLGTVEEMIYLRQVYKQQLHCAVVGSENAKRYFKAVQGSTGHKGELFGIHNLFKLRIQGTCLTRDILEREGQVEAGIKSATMYLSQQSVTSDTNTDGSIENEEKNLKSHHRFPKEGFDFTSDSDDEINDDSRRKSNASAGADRGKQLTLQQCDFSRLLETALGDQDKKSDLSGSPSSEHSKIKSNNAYTACKFKKGLEVTGKERRSSNLGLNILSDSDEDSDPVVKNKGQISEAVMETNSSSDESDNVVFPTQANKSNVPIKSAMRARVMPQSDESVSSDFECNTPKKKMRNLSDCGSDYISDESDDIAIPSIPSFLKQRNTSYPSKGDTEKKNSQTIDDFSSSEDDDFHGDKIFSHHPEQTGKTTIYKDSNSNRSTTKMKSVVHKKYSRTNLDNSATDKTLVTQKESLGSLDRIFDGVAEVAYIHSNQNVVGSSKAENHMSRSAVRDVFELKQFSQLPANITSHLLEKCDFTKQKILSQKNKEEEKESNSILRYPLVHKQSQVLQVSEKMFLLGETPRSMIKRHFEQMVSYFKMDSTEQLAHHLVKVNSHVRQSMLREFYASQHTEVAELYPVHAPLLERERDSIPKIRDVEIKSKKRRKKTHLPKEALETHVNTNSNHTIVLDIDLAESDDIKPDKKIDTPPITEKGTQCQSNTLQRMCSPYREFEMAEPHTSAISDQINNVTHYKALKQEKVKNKAKSVSDLLGDTSILDDLFSNSTLRQASALPVRTQCDSVTTKFRHRTKDFWDILTEQNDESINRLTDLSVIEKACETSIVPSVAKKETWNDSLWVNNDNFVWKKYETSNSEAPSSSKSCHQ
ncbi:PREDICTED: DNA excision repair protein ERCC-6-like 2 [Nanorana parkeri]|uniref:DNA excision repair protein ERCC-6-like 2 n=1 Tax=Nanorana parkeri TaxID=125878 RepID=UPI0008548653|nr:PREDICTED: DNA excision repair protein ERCC-6-like 2 [Nanorana parkeri]